MSSAENTEPKVEETKPVETTEVWTAFHSDARRRYGSCPVPHHKSWSALPCGAMCGLLDRPLGLLRASIYLVAMQRVDGVMGTGQDYSQRAFYTCRRNDSWSFMFMMLISGA
jgi:hypothetical protein